MKIYLSALLLHPAEGLKAPGTFFADNNRAGRPDQATLCQQRYLRGGKGRDGRNANRAGHLVNTADQPVDPIHRAPYHGIDTGNDLVDSAFYRIYNPVPYILDCVTNPGKHRGRCRGYRVPCAGQKAGDPLPYRNGCVFDAGSQAGKKRSNGAADRHKEISNRLERLLAPRTHAVPIHPKRHAYGDQRADCHNDNTDGVC